MRRATLRSVVVCLAVGLSACDTANTLRPVTREQAVAACVAYTSCIPGDGVHRCFERHLLGFSPEEIRCLAAAGSSCARAAACVGVTVTAYSGDGGCGRSCQDGRLVTCGDNFRIATDCARWSASDSTCLSSSLTAGCGLASCTMTSERCDGTRRVVCDRGVLTVTDCRIGGALTCAQSGATTQCVGTGGECVGPEGSTRCDGDVLVRCTNGREERRDCRIGFEGGGCRVRTDSQETMAFCGYDTGCRPKSGEEACSGDGTKLSFCAAGKIETIDCVQLGYRGCAGRACAPVLR